MTHLVGTNSVGGFRRSALLRGFASALDLGGQTLRQYRLVATAEQEDSAAVRDDWRQVGGDLTWAVKEHSLACPSCGRTGAERAEHSTGELEATPAAKDPARVHVAARGQ